MTSLECQKAMHGVFDQAEGWTGQGFQSGLQRHRSQASMGVRERQCKQVECVLFDDFSPGLTVTTALQEMVNRFTDSLYFLRKPDLDDGC